MGLFGKNKTKVNKEVEKNQSRKLMSSFDLMEYFIVKDRSDETIYDLCDTILSGKPVLANFDKLSVNDCNYILAFMSGVIYATAGEVITVGERLFLFARQEEFEDGTLREYVEDIHHS